MAREELIGLPDIYKEKAIEGLAREEMPPLEGIEMPEVRKPSFEETYTPRDWELKYATGKFGATYPTVRAIAEIIPFTRYIFPSGRDAYMAKSTAGQTVEGLIEAVSILPTIVIGRGLKVVGKGFGLVGKAGTRRLMRLPKIEQEPFLDALMKEIPKFERLTPAEKIAKNYNLSMDEATQVVKKEPWVWELVSERSGARTMTKGREEFRNLFTKEGTLRSKVEAKLTRWSRPQEVQELSFYKQEWGKLVKKRFKASVSHDQIFRSQTFRLFGKEGNKLEWGDIDNNTLGNMLLDLLRTKPKKLLKGTEIAYGHILPYHTKPTDKVFGIGEDLWETHSKIYRPAKQIFGEANKYAFINTTNFHVILASRGLAKIKALKTGEFSVKRLFSKLESEEAGKLVMQIDKLQSQGVDQKIIQATFGAAPEKVQLIAKSHYDFLDYFYSDYMKKKIWMEFEKVGLTPKGKDSLTLLMKGPKGMERILDEAFSVGANVKYSDKAAIVTSELERAKNLVSKENLDWFIESENLPKSLKNLVAELSPMKPKGKVGFVNYLENYAPRIGDKGAILGEERVGALAPKRLASFRKQRLSEIADEPTEDLGRMLDARIRAQAKELYVFPHLPELVKVARTLPPKYRSYTEHYLARMLGDSSNTDVSVAQWLTTSTPGIVNDRQVRQLARTINDLVYTGGLGFKPFSALRNYFQVLLMVPADLGGIRDFFWMARGIKAAFDPKVRSYIRSIGAIQEFAPELYLRPSALPYGPTVKFKGVRLDLPSMGKVRDVALWLFKQSEYHCRYAAGGAAIRKWDYYLKKIAKDGVLDEARLNKFTKKINLNSRESWHRSQISDSLRKGTLSGVEEAKKLWVNNVIGDTQYLYGVADAPIITHTAGALGRTGFIFQSWWANYGAQIEKYLLRTPGLEPKIERLITFWLSGAITQEIASALWDKRSTKQMRYLGPFPGQVSEYAIPPSWAPVYHIMNGLREIGSVAESSEIPEIARKNLNKFLRSAIMFVPGGLQISTTYKALKKEPTPTGFFKSLIRYKEKED